MPYSLKDVDAAEAHIRANRPETAIDRGDFGWALSVADVPGKKAFILFRPERENQSEISATPQDIDQVLFYLGPQWTAEQVKQMMSRASKP